MEIFVKTKINAVILCYRLQNIPPAGYKNGSTILQSPSMQKSLTKINSSLPSPP